MRGRKPLAERNSSIRELVASGKTTVEVAAIFGISKQRVHQIYGRAITTKTDRILMNGGMALLNSGYSYVGVASKYNVSSAALRTRAHKLGTKRTRKCDIHGHSRCYENGCRCRLCTDANTNRCKVYRISNGSQAHDVQETL